MKPPLDFDPNDKPALRAFFESLRGQLQNYRSTWESQWDQCSQFFAPRSSRISQSDVNMGQRRDQSIINETGGLALRVLKAGMLTGMSSQTRPWFKMETEDKSLMDNLEVRVWLQDVEQKCRDVLIKSNFYQTLLNLYGEEGLYGTSAFLLLEDDETVIRCTPFVLGIGGDCGYYLFLDDALRVAGCVRIFNMTPQQMVQRFGYDHVSPAMQVLYRSNAGGVKEQWYPVVHVMVDGDYFGPGKLKADDGRNYPYISAYYELSNYNQKQGFLRVAGFLECPLIVGRWDVIGENVYGESCAMQVLGSVMSLQAWEERLAQAAEKQFNPPMVVGTDVDPRRVTTLPGDIIFADVKDVQNVMRSAYQIDFRLGEGLNAVQRIEARINDGMYRTLFQMFSESDRREITAEEIRARMSEKMQVLGPVVERNTQEVLAPSIKRTIGIMQRRGMLPRMPDALKGHPIKLEFISILAQAQKMGAINNLGQLMNFVGAQAALDPTVLDKINRDEAITVYSQLVDAPAKVLNSDEQVAQIRQQRAQQQQASMAADNAQKMAGAANDLSQARLGTGSLLDQALPALTGG